MVLFEPDFVNFWLAVMTQGSRVELAVTRMRKLSDLTWEKDGALNQTSFAYTRGRVSQVTDEAAKNRSFTYDSSNNKMQTTDERGYNWGPTYDSAGNVLTSKNPYNATTNFSYDNFNLQIRQVNANGRMVTFDSANRTTDVLQKSSTSATLAHYV